LKTSIAPLLTFNRCQQRETTLSEAFFMVGPRLAVRAAFNPAVKAVFW